MENIRDILTVQRREIEEKFKAKYVEREIDYRKFESDLIKVITGPRRAGKSFLGIHFLKKIGEFGYINFEDERLLKVENYDDLINSLFSVYGDVKIIFLDEIQDLNNWEIFVSRLHRQGFNVIITGSNSKLLSRELSTYLTGRHIPIFIFPFSFSEFLKLNNSNLTNSEIKSIFNEYVLKGGFPEPIVKKIDIKDYISILFDSLLYKDIVRRYRIRKPAEIEELALYLISNTGMDFSYNTLAKITGCKSVHTVEKYINFLEEAYIIFKIPRFSFKVKEQLKTNKKFYCIDNGFVYAKSLKSTQDKGFLYENVVSVELKKKELEGKIKVYYWRNEQGEEIDFVVKKGIGVKYLIQVCYDLNNIKTREREIRSLIKGKVNLKCEDLIILNGEYEGFEKVNWFGEKGEIKFIPLWKWLLNKEKFI